MRYYASGPLRSIFNYVVEILRLMAQNKLLRNKQIQFCVMLYYLWETKTVLILEKMLTFVD